jgi:hypothetical protein
MISKLVPLLMGLVGLVVTCFYLRSSPKIDDVTTIVLVLVPISTYTKEGGSYLKFRKVVW